MALFAATSPLSATAEPYGDGAMVQAILKNAFDQEGDICVDNDFSRTLRPVDPYTKKDIWDAAPEVAAAWKVARPVSARFVNSPRLMANFKGAVITHDLAHCRRAVHFDLPLRARNMAFVVRHIFCADLCGRGDVLAYRYEGAGWRRVASRPLYTF